MGGMSALSHTYCILMLAPASVAFSQYPLPESSCVTGKIIILLRDTLLSLYFSSRK